MPYQPYKTIARPRNVKELATTGVSVYPLTLVEEQMPQYTAGPGITITGHVISNNLVNQCGIYAVPNNVTTVTIPITGLTATGVVLATYVHPGAGGGSQWFKTITPGAGSVTITLGSLTATGETIVWFAPTLS